jgi:hypothetical protein
VQYRGQALEVDNAKLRVAFVSAEELGAKVRLSALLLLT